MPTMSWDDVVNKGRNTNVADVENPDVDIFPRVSPTTRELKGEVELPDRNGNHIKTPVLVSRFASFPANEIADDIMHKLGDRTALPDLNPLALPKPEDLLGDEVDIDDYLGEGIPRPQARP